MRLNVALKERVDRATALLGVNASAVIRTLLERFVEHCEQHGGRIVMPPEFKSYEIRDRAVAEGHATYGKVKKE